MASGTTIAQNGDLLPSEIRGQGPFERADLDPCIELQNASSREAEAESR
jgi:hypothetical protein